MLVSSDASRIPLDAISCPYSDSSKAVRANRRLDRVEGRSYPVAGPVNDDAERAGWGRRVSDASRAKNPRISGKRAFVILVALLIVFVFGLDFISRVIFAPWSIGLFGRETMTGNWVGEMRAQQGAAYGLFLDLDYKSQDIGGRRNSGNGRTSNLAGHATVCTPTGERFDYEVSGHASRSGKVESLRLEYGDPSLSALDLRFSGGWDAPELTLTSDANPFLPDGRFVATRSLSSADPDDSFAPATLTKAGSESFEDICQRVQQ
jgi:hypothetical protein